MTVAIRKILFVCVLFYSFNNLAQQTIHNIELSAGFNRIGFFNQASFKIDIKNNQFKLGLRHYTIDNFFEKNTIGMSLGYNYKVTSKSNKTYFYPGVNTAFFIENKTNSRVFISDYKLINGIGVNLNSKWSLYYQLGFGVVTTKTYVIDIGDVISVPYFNYEMLFGVCYQLGGNSKNKNLK
jgi:hypothetical protein